MKVKIELQERLQEAYAVIFTEKITDEISRISEMLANESQDYFLALLQDEKYIFVKPEEIYLVRFEDQHVNFYGEKSKYDSKLRLYEAEEKLGSLFIRISKTTLVNLKQIESVEPSFSGTMCLKLKNGCKDYISRKYLPQFKKKLGI